MSENSPAKGKETKQKSERPIVVWETRRDGRGGKRGEGNAGAPVPLREPPASGEATVRLVPLTDSAGLPEGAVVIRIASSGFGGAQPLPAHPNAELRCAA